MNRNHERRSFVKARKNSRGENKKNNKQDEKVKRVGSTRSSGGGEVEKEKKRKRKKQMSRCSEALKEDRLKGRERGVRGTTRRRMRRMRGGKEEE